MEHKLNCIFEPKSIAAIGASDRTSTVGNALIQNLLGGSYKGKVYAVNPGHLIIQGQKSYRSILKIPEQIDLAIIAAPARVVPKVVEECGQAKAGGIVIISAGFNEAGEEGKKMFKQILETANKYRIPLLGPNCVGFTNPKLGLNASFAKNSPPPGKIAFISQSGALGTAIIDWANDQSVGISKFISVGAMLDIGFHDLIDYLGADQNTSSILIYMESLKNARRFMSAARSFARKKPIIIIKAGKSAEGAKASLSHTGSLAGNDRVYRAAFKRAGVLQVETIQQLFNCAEAIAMQSLPKNNRLCIVTNAGGPGVLATDFLISKRGKLSQLTPDTIQQLDSILPGHWSRGNPVDVLGDAQAETYMEALKICERDPNVDALLALFAPQAITHPANVAKHVIAHSFEKPILACWMGEGEVEEGREILEQGRIPNYRYPENVVDVFLNMHAYSSHLQLLYETPPNVPEEFTPEVGKARKLIRHIYSEGRTVLNEHESKLLLSYYQIPVPKGKIVDSPELAREVANEIGYPVVLKLEATGLGHKTDIGGVVLNLKDELEVGNAYNLMISRARAVLPAEEISGIRVEEMINKDFEVFIGTQKDPVFGPVIVFGSGGLLVELLDDVNMGLPPLNMALAKQVIENTKIYKVLKGYRGMESVDMDALQFLLVKFSFLVMDFPEIKEIDVNPFALDSSGGVALDAHVVLDESHKSSDDHQFHHLVISPYPTQLHRDVILKNGQSVHLRPIKPEDEPMEAAMFKKLSQQSIYQRFFGYIKDMDHDMLIKFTNIDYDREMAIIALLEEDGQIQMAGVVRIVSDAWNERAEYAIVVADPWQGLGLGSAMTDYIIEIARAKNIKNLFAEVLHSNESMLYLLNKRGFSFKKNIMGVEYLELEL